MHAYTLAIITCMHVCMHRLKPVKNFFADYKYSMAVAEAKQRKTNLEKQYKKLKKNPRPKLYDKPPYLIKDNE